MTKISELDTIPVVDRTTDLIEIVDNSDLSQSFKVTPNSLLGFTGGNPVSTTDTQTLTNKTLTSPTINTPTLTVLDSALTIQDNSDPTKQAKFEASSITAGQTRTYTLPDASTTLVGTGTTQTLTGKTLTAPTITNPTLTVDTINEFTSANGVTIDGVLLKDSKINGSYITDSSVSATQINFGGSGSGVWWQEIGRTTLSVAGDTISVTSIPSRRYLQIFVIATATGGTINATLRFNNDSGANYSARSSANGGADGTGVSATSMGMSATASTADRMIEAYIRNITTLEKLLSGHCIEQGTAGAGSTTSRAELANKWANTVAQINRIDIINAGAGDFAIGSELVVLGHD